MKKGISLIVLVITILVLAILAGAIIISLSSTNVIEQASKAATAADLANAKSALTLAYSKAVAHGFENGRTDGMPYYTNDASEVVLADEAYYVSELKAAGYDKVMSKPDVDSNATGYDTAKWVVSVDTARVPSVATK